MNYYKVTIISTGSVYTQEGREILKDADIEITLGGGERRRFIPFYFARV